jgi:UDP-N-acetylglucosamine/UDP-N-acetylgalactosamine diphosphorylase
MKAESFLKRWGQSHLLLSIQTKEEARLQEELLSFDEEALVQQKDSFSQNGAKAPLLFSPLKNCSKKNEQIRKRGEELLSSGKVAPLLLAAGEGTRLGFRGPKGCFPMTAVKNKSLFQIFSEKILAAQKKYGREFFLMIMTSFLNHQQTLEFFEKNNFFGLKKEQVCFFCQDLLPFCDGEGKWFFDETKQIAKGAGGNGSVYKSFVRANLLQKCQEKGIEKILLFPIDNPLADPCDADLVELHEEKNAMVALSAIKRPKAEMSMGVLAETLEGIRVVEYMEINKEEMVSFPLANAGLYCMSLSFFEKAAALSLPLHRVKKRILFQGKEKEIFKFERFIFDGFAHSTKTEALFYEKNSCFAPLKQMRGKDGLAAVRRALLSKERKLFHSLTKRIPEQKIFELSFEFYYPTRELSQHYCKKFSLHENYFRGIDL